MVNPPASLPTTLRVAVTLAAAEAAVLVVLGVLELLALRSDRLTMGLTTAGFFLLAGLGLGLCARALGQRQSWARSPVVMSQLIALGVAWSFWGNETTWIGALLVLVVLTVLIGIFHPRSLAALDAEG